MANFDAFFDEAENENDENEFEFRVLKLVCFYISIQFNFTINYKDWIIS